MIFINKITCKQIKNQKGSITLFVLIAVIFFLAIAFTAYVSSINKVQVLDVEFNKIKSNYETSYKDEEIKKIYEDKIESSNPGPETTLPTIKEAKNNEEFTKDGNKEITDGKDTMWVPQDFKVVDGESIETGVVIQDGVENQFVWVPVPDINEMCTDNAGKLYEFSGTGANVTSSPITNSSYREPDILTNEVFGDKSTDDPVYRGIDHLKNIVKVSTIPKEGSSMKLEKDIIIENWEDELKSNFKKMKESVEKYKGFYIGRYETSDLETEKPKVQKEQEATTDINWYTMYKNSENIAYKNETEKITSVTSSMIWGCQWDATLNWFLRSEDEKIKGYVTNSARKGWYNQEAKKPTGTPIENDENEVNKIWDMAGNVSEWTLEAEDTYNRVNRGGNSVPSGFYTAVSDRGVYNPCNSDSYCGSRCVLYINK